MASFDRTRLEALLRERFFVTPSFDIYGTIAGFFDYGPPGAALQANILETWRRFFVVEEDMHELDTTTITSAPVFRASGHVDRFTDWMTRDAKVPGNIYRVDHLIKAALEARIQNEQEARRFEASGVTKGSEKSKGGSSVRIRYDDETLTEYESTLAVLDNLSGSELGEVIRKYSITAPETGNELDEPREFNLMFEMQIGPTGQQKGYLRPETAQGHFINFNRLLEFNNGRLPFASTQIGKAYRNEISPRQGLLRVREFTMAEIEHYVDPLRKEHARFAEVADTQLRLLPKDVQLAHGTQTTLVKIGDAVAQGIVDNSTLGYFLARIHLFLLKVGVDPVRLRFRQHLPNEMAHYAADCWDAEIQTSYGWIECVGCADRSAYDLTMHSQASNQRLVVREALKEPEVSQRFAFDVDMKVVGQRFKPRGKLIKEAIEGLNEDAVADIDHKLQSHGSATLALPNGDSAVITPDCVTMQRKTYKKTVREYTPNVIEPSFGIGRILYALLEHSFWSRPESAQRAVLSLPPIVAPVKCLIIPISSNASFKPLLAQLAKTFRNLGITSRVDDSNASIGKRYSRNDELGTPFGVTVDFASVQNGTVTLRERDSCKQYIGSTDDVVSVVHDLCRGVMAWDEASQRLSPYTGQQDLQE